MQNPKQLVFLFVTALALLTNDSIFLSTVSDCFVSKLALLENDSCQHISVNYQ